MCMKEICQLDYLGLRFPGNGVSAMFAIHVSTTPQLELYNLVPVSRLRKRVKLYSSQPHSMFTLTLESTAVARLVTKRGVDSLDAGHCIECGCVWLTQSCVQLSKSKMLR